MGKAEAGTPKAIANAIKAKGLGRLRWYCQICEKQCRDENGFLAHTRSEPHLRKMISVGPKAGQTIAEFSRQFQYEFVTLLRTRHQTNRVRANAVYNEYIQDKHHVHMNATRWVTLSGFIMTIGKAGIVKVDEDEKGLWVTWVDSSPKTLAKQAALQKRDRATMDGEERERKNLEDQIARAKAAQGDTEEQDVGLQKKDGEKITLNLFDSGIKSEDEIKKEEGSSQPEAEAGPSQSQSQSDPSHSPETDIDIKPETTKPIISFGATPSAISLGASANPLKRPAPVNIFKQAKSAKTESESGGQRKGYISEAERLMKEDQARKMRGPGGYGGFGPKRDAVAGGGRRFVLQ